MTRSASRRTFLKAALATTAAPWFERLAFANPLGLPLGIQLYSVRQQMAEDLDAALAAVQAAGFTEVEAAALPKSRSAAEVRAALDKAGLRCVSAHHPFSDLHANFDEVVAFDKQLGVQFIICASPGYASSSAPGSSGAPKPYTLEDWEYNADQFNSMGAKLLNAGLRFGYHNHTREFTVIEGKTPYFELLRLTDPNKVTMELDCGWAVVAGVNPADLMRQYPDRISMLHVKDFKLNGTPVTDPHEAKVTEMGQGSIDYRPIFEQAAKTQHIKHAFVEQEAFDMPWRESLKVDAEYLRKMKS